MQSDVEDYLSIIDAEEKRQEPLAEVVEVKEVKATTGWRGPEGSAGRTPKNCSTYTTRRNAALPVGQQPLYNENEHLPDSYIQRYKSEQPAHRIVAYMKAQGMSNKEIAEQTGYSYGAVCQIVRLPWVRDVIVDEIARRGGEAVQTVLQSAALDCVIMLHDTVLDEKEQTRDRITASKELLDRLYGKPNQPVTHREEVDLSKLTDAELAKIAMSAKGIDN